jgi:hypothetical protein
VDSLSYRTEEYQQYGTVRISPKKEAAGGVSRRRLWLTY